MNLYQTLVEALNEFQQNYLRDDLGGNYYNPKKSHPEMFDSYEKSNPHRIILPLETTNLNHKVDPQIKFHLKSHGWDIHNYHAGLSSRQSIDRDGKPKLEIKKIGKVLQQTGADKVIHSQPRVRLIKGSDGKPLIGEDGRMKSEKVPQSLLDFYNADKTRDSVKAEHNMVISRDLDDIGGMTSGRDWEDNSCMRLPKHNEDFYNKGNDDGGQYHNKIADDLENHTLVAYATKRGDDELERPIGRVLIKKYESTEPINGEHHYIYRPETKTYGNVPDGFVDQVESLTKKHYPAHKDIGYILHDDLYDDGRSEIEPSRIGLHTDEYGTKNYNSRGQLHDYVDEHGVNQPAVDTPHEIGHYKNGKLHTDDDTPAKITMVDGHRYYHYKNGELHRDGDKPAIYNDKGTHEEYYFGGVRHRDGNLPSYISKSLTKSDIQYHHAGLLHRTDGAASDVREFAPHIPDIPLRQTTQWFENGQPLKSETTPFLESSENGKVVSQQFNHDNIDKPTTIANRGKGTVLIFGNRKKGNTSRVINPDGTYENTYGGDRSNRIGDFSHSITYNNDPIGFIYNGSRSYHILKTDDNNLHLIDHRNKSGYKLTPDNKISTYTIPSELSSEDDRWKNYNELVKPISQKDSHYSNYTKTNLSNRVHEIKPQMYNSEMPSKYTDMIDRFDKAVN